MKSEKQKIVIWEIVGGVFTAAAGSGLHFLYDAVGGGAVIGIFAASNESVWEHLKLLFWPFLLFAAVEWAFLGRGRRGFWAAKAAAIWAALTLQLALFYTYSGIVGQNVMAVDIVIFLLCAAAAAALGCRAILRGRFGGRGAGIAAVLLLAAAAALFVIFTFFPPKTPLFFDPQAGVYGPTID